LVPKTLTRRWRVASAQKSHQGESRVKANRNDERLQGSICFPGFVLGDSDRKRLFDGTIVTGILSSVRLPYPPTIRIAQGPSHSGHMHEDGSGKN
jgi:hypothetical protein